ncbi:DUF2840 domain-containing protein [uncultured Hyphomonas sp.]|uniref:DUF2840 domain-containing protein n=1 Tax=uncultured Hyphomonas sp. TaxID=225298 RepID=UPI0030DC9E3E
MTPVPSDLTLVSVSWRKNRRNHRVLFGAPRRWIRLDWRRRIAVFQPGDIFAYERWSGDRFGTQSWQVFVLQACTPGSGLQVLPGIKPGAEILVSAHGKPAAKRLLALLDRLECTRKLGHMSEHDWRQIGLLQTEKLERTATLLARGAVL